VKTASAELTAVRPVAWSSAALLRGAVALLADIAGLALVVMIIVTCVDVVGREFRHPLKGAYDLVELLGAITITGALPYTTACKGHVAIELLVHKLPRRGRSVMNVFVQTVSLLVFAFLTWRFVQYGAELRAAGQVTLTLRWPIFWMAYWMALCTAVMTLVLLYQMVHPGKELMKP
jgi:TRAP-type C4-dicarboxylate transport system permease small subunit